MALKVKIKNLNIIDIAFILPFKYKNIEYLKKCIQSIKDNAINYQIIVVDDHSQLNYKSKFKIFQNITLISNKANLGPARSRNIGLDYAKAKYICFLDADDTLAANFQLVFDQEILKMKENTPILFLSHSIDKNDRSIFNLINFLRNTVLAFVAKKYQFLPKSLFYAVSTSRLIIPMKIAKKFKFDSKLRQCEDWDLAIKLIQNVGIKVKNQKIINYRYYEDSQTKIQLKNHKTTIYKEMLQKSGIEFNFFTFIFKLYILYLELRLK